MTFLPSGFEVPVLVETDRFRLRPITVDDVIKDYDAVMTSREHLWELFGEGWGWPPEDLTLEQDLIDLAWHEKEFELGSSFDYAVMSIDETRLLGCVYVDPPEREGFDAEVYFWARSSELAGGLELELEQIVRAWIANDWPFANVSYPGRDVDWATWDPRRVGEVDEKHRDDSPLARGHQTIVSASAGRRKCETSRPLRPERHCRR